MSEETDWVIIVGGGDLTMPAYRIAREDLGLGIIAMDFNAASPGMQVSDLPICVSTKDTAACVQAAREAARDRRIIGVFTCGADVEITISEIAAALSLKGISPEVARRCNDKLLMHEYLDKIGFTEKARYFLATSPQEARAAALEIGFPVVVKPIDNCASRGVQRLQSAEEMDEAFELAVSFNGPRGARILVEQCLIGTKHTIEMIAWQGQWHLCSIIDTHYISPRWPCETGLNTTQQSAQVQQDMFDFATRAARSLGIDFGAHKVDINLSPEGEIRLIELTARLSGGFHCQFASPLAFGSNDIRAALKLATGQPLDLDDIRHQYEKGSAVRVAFPSPGRIVAIEGLEQARSAPGVEQVFIMKQPGDIAGPYHNSADRFAYVIARGETTEEAIRNAEKGVAMLRIQTEPLGN